MESFKILSQSLCSACSGDMKAGKKCENSDLLEDYRHPLLNSLKDNNSEKEDNNFLSK